MSKRLINVLLVDDAPIIYDALTHNFTQHGSIKLVAYAQSPLDAVHIFGRVRADVALIDVLMPDMNGLELAEIALRADPNLHVLFYSAFYSPAYVKAARALGAAGWVIKESIEELIAAIEQAAAGISFIEPCSERRATILPSIDAPFIPLHGKEALTEREIEVLCLTVQSFEVKEIADRLGISVRTVEVHRAHIFQKLHTRSIPQITKYAIAHGYAAL